MAVEPSQAPRFSTAPVNPPRPTLAQAALRNLPLVLLPLILLVGGAVAYGLTRSPKYTSVAQLNVGGVNLSVQAIPGYTPAVSQLAVTYARSLDATAVIGPVASKTGLSQRTIVSLVSAAPVEGSSVVRISANSPNAAQAERLADATADALVVYAGQLTRTNPDTPRLLKQFVADSKALRDATTALSRARTPKARADAQTRADVAKLRQQTDSALYAQSQSGGSATSLVQKIAPAAAATSDRDSVLERFVVAALVGGGLIGVGLALARENAVRRRRLA